MIYIYHRNIHYLNGGDKFYLLCILISITICKLLQFHFACRKYDNWHGVWGYFNTLHLNKMVRLNIEKLSLFVSERIKICKPQQTGPSGYFPIFPDFLLGKCRCQQQPQGILDLITVGNQWQVIVYTPFELSRIGKHNHASQSRDCPH